MKRYDIYAKGGHAYLHPAPLGQAVEYAEAQAEMDHLYEALERAALEIVRLEDKVKQARAETLREAADAVFRFSRASGHVLGVNRDRSTRYDEDVKIESVLRQMAEREETTRG